MALDCLSQAVIMREAWIKAAIAECGIAEVKP